MNLLLPRWGVGLILAVILLGGAGLRLFGRDWDGGALLHPDERFIALTAIDRLALPPPGAWADLLNPATSVLNPRRLHGDAPYAYHYGTLPLYLATARAWLDATLTPDGARPSYDDVALTGRTLAALADVGTIFLVFLLAWRLYGPGPGLVAAALSACAVIQIQLAHFLISEPFLVFFLTGLLYGTLRAAQTGYRVPLLAAGACLGLALACKASVAPLGLLLVLGAGGFWILDFRFRMGEHSHAGVGGGMGVGDQGSGIRDQESAAEETGDDSQSKIQNPKSKIRWRTLALAVGMVGLGWFVGDPYALLDLPTYVTQVVEEAAVQSGRLDVPFTLQYVGTWPGLYQAQQLGWWGLGPAAGLAALVGLGVAGRRAWRGGGGERLLLLGFAVYALTILPLEAKWLRYTVPLVPILCVFTSGLLTVHRKDAEAQRFAESAAPNPRRLRITHYALRILVAVALIGSAAWAVAFEHIYTQEHTRIAASRWLAASVPAGQGVSAEVWDDRLPVVAPGLSRVAYKEVAFDLYQDRPNEAVFAHIRDALAATDVLVLSSNRLYASIPRLPWRYPVQIRYYQLLFAGQLGFTPVYTATSYPTLGPWTIVDDSADESFTVYDHPKVLIFRKTRALPEDELRVLFAAALGQPAVSSRTRP